MDAQPSSGGDGEGFTPVELILAGLGGCTGMDIVTIMQRQRQHISGLEVNVTGTKRNELPHYFEAIDVHYVVRGHNITRISIEKSYRAFRREVLFCKSNFQARGEVDLQLRYCPGTQSELN